MQTLHPLDDLLVDWNWGSVPGSSKCSSTFTWPGWRGNFPTAGLRSLNCLVVPDIAAVASHSARTMAYEVDQSSDQKRSNRLDSNALATGRARRRDGVVSLLEGKPESWSKLDVRGATHILDVVPCDCFRPRKVHDPSVKSEGLLAVKYKWLIIRGATVEASDPAVIGKTISESESLYDAGMGTRSTESSVGSCGRRSLSCPTPLTHRA